MDNKALIDKYKDDNIILHLSKTQIDCARKCACAKQLYVFGFNAGGRPDGLWTSRGSNWIGKVEKLDNPKFPACCYLYEVKMSPKCNLLQIDNDHDFTRFDEEFPSYWVNFDYFDMNFTDYITGERIISKQKCPLILSQLQRSATDTLYDILIKNRIIFIDAQSAQNCCEFYSSITIPIDRLKYKNWAEVVKKYNGITFSNWEQCTDAMKYIWFQSLDISSSCMWDISCVDQFVLLYSKIDDKWI